MGLFGSDTHHYHNTHTKETKLVPYEKTVHEHKAPTDDSIRLLNEFEEKAKLNILSKINIDTNTIKAKGIYFTSTQAFEYIEYFMRIDINGTEHIIRGKVDRTEWQEEHRNAYMGFGIKGVFEAVHKRFSEVIAYELMKASPDFIKTIQAQHNGR